MDNLVEFEFRHADERTWRLRMADIRVDEWAEVEELSGMDAGELFSRFLGFSMRARKAMYFLARKREGDGVKWDSDELNFRAGDLVVADVTPERKTEEDEGTDPPEGGAEPPSETP